MAEIVDRGQQEIDDLEIPRFALVITPALVKGGWHLAALIREQESPEFYLRSLAVRFPYVIARPMPGNRQHDILYPPHTLSPTGTSPARKLVVNWAWSPAGDGTEQLRFFVKRNLLRWVLPHHRLRLRLGLKEQQPPQRRFAVNVRSNPIDWRTMATPEPAGPAAEANNRA